MQLNPRKHTTILLHTKLRILNQSLNLDTEIDTLNQCKLFAN